MDHVQIEDTPTLHQKYDINCRVYDTSGHTIPQQNKGH